MSQLTVEPSSASDLVRARTSRARAGIIAVMVGGIVLAGVTRDWALRKRVEAASVSGTATGGARSSLGSMNSFSLALLLGGLRGPLVMFLWSTSESQKAEKNLEDFDTKVEWIRLLQPEFDSVHIFQVWNKAYNISVQMASLNNKYTTILDALEYARSVLRARPNNINLTVSLAQVYTDKLGNAGEKLYYKRRVRAETLPHPLKQRLDRDDPAWRPLEHEIVLDEKGNIKPEFLAPKWETATASGTMNDGSALQYLAPYQPFPYGLSPIAIGYNYYKQAQVLQRVARQKHSQLSDMVVDSRPGLTLKQWAEDEYERGRRAELTAYGLPLPADSADKPALEIPSIELPAGKAPNEAMIAQALDAYGLIPHLCDDSIAEYEDHLKLYTGNMMTYESHVDGLVATREMAAGDRDFLMAQFKTGDERKKLLASAATHYRDAADQNYRILLRYYADDQMAARYFPNGMNRSQTKQIPAPQLAGVYGAIRAEVMQMQMDPYGEDRMEYETYIRRAEARLRQCK
jgi:hypothetical protein